MAGNISFGVNNQTIYNSVLQIYDTGTLSTVTTSRNFFTIANSAVGGYITLDTDNLNIAVDKWFFNGVETISGTGGAITTGTSPIVNLQSNGTANTVTLPAASGSRIRKEIYYDTETAAGDTYELTLTGGNTFKGGYTKATFNDVGDSLTVVDNNIGEWTIVSIFNTVMT
jgi:hypothetical protein